MNPDVPQKVLAAVMGLWAPSPELREAALATLKALYVRCDEEGCVTDPDVAGLALPYAERALKDAEPEIRVAGARAVELFAADGEPFVRLLADALGDAVQEVRVAVLEALCEFGGAASEFSALVAQRVVLGSTPEERSEAIHALANMHAIEAVPVLVRALVTDVPSVQAAAAHALSCALEAEGEVQQTASSALHALRMPPADLTPNPPTPLSLNGSRNG